MKKQLLTCLGLVVAALIAPALMAQTLGEFKPNDQSFGLKKAAGADRIYIASFNVNFQVYNEKQDYKQGGYQLGGGMKGESLAEVSVGIEGLDEKTVQQITDKLYKEYIDKLKGAGLTIVGADEAAKIDSYQDFERVKGGSVTMAEIPGVITVTPTGYEYFVKGFDKDGKSKKGGFLGNPAMMYPGISKGLNDAIVGAVDLTFLFVEDQNAFSGSGAKLKVKTNLRLIGVESVVMTSDAAVKFKGQNTVTMVTSTAGFYHGKAGAGATTTYSGSLSKPMQILGVLEDEKITSYANAGVASGVSTIYGTYYSVRNTKTKNAKVLQVDPVKYSEGAYAAGSKFLNYHLDEFLASRK